MTRQYITVITVCALALHYLSDTAYPINLTLLNTLLPGHKKTSPQPSDSLYTSLLEQLLETQLQHPTPQSDMQTTVEPWILQLFSNHLQHQMSPYPEELNQAQHRKQNMLSMLTLSLEEYRKKSKSTK